MSKANIVIMGKTGAGKSTLVNAILGVKKAKTGLGSAQTSENKIYSHVIRLSSGTVSLELMDTVGLELDSRLNAKTIQSVRSRIDMLSRKYMEEHSDIDEINMVWYCINSNGRRIEDFDENFIKEMMFDYEIPFMIVLTQCYDKRNAAAMQEKIHEIFPEMPMEIILAEDYDIGITIGAYGVRELLDKTVTKFNDHKLNVLQKKLDRINSERSRKEAEKERWINSCRQSSCAIIEEKAKKAFKLGCVPFVSLGSLQAVYYSMCKEVAGEFGINLDEDMIWEIVALCAGVAVFAVVFAIPGLSGAVAKEYISDEGVKYLDSIVSAVRASSEAELSDSKLVSQRLLNEIKRRENK